MRETKKYAVFKAADEAKYGQIMAVYISEKRALSHANKLRKAIQGEQWVGIRTINWDHYPLVVLVESPNRMHTTKAR